MKDCRRIRWWDLAASEKPDAARTAGVKMARHRSGVRAVEHCLAFRATPGKRDDRIVQTAQADGKSVIVGIEIEGGSGGIAQFDALEKRLKAYGFRCTGARPRAELTDLEGRLFSHQSHSPGAKAARADPVASCVQRGAQRRGEFYVAAGQDYDPTLSPWWALDAELPVTHHRDGIRLFAGPWTQDFLDELEGFPDVPLMDIADALSGAWTWHQAHPWGERLPLELREKATDQTEQHDVHPTERKPAERPGTHWTL